MSAADPVPRLDRIRSGIEGLDTILKDGVLQASINIIQGTPGTGKTILANQLCFNHAANGGRCLYVTLLAETHARMLLHIGNLAFYNTNAIPGRVYYISGFPILEAEGLSGLLSLLRREVRARDVTLLVIDGLVTAENTSASSLAFKKFIHELQTLAGASACSVFLLRSAGGEGATPPIEHTMVDCVIDLRSRLYGWRAERDLEILKRRGAAFLRGAHAFRITDDGIVVYPRFEAAYAMPRHQAGPNPERLTTGLPELDALLHGGLRRGSATMVLGPPGAGKTTLGLQFLSQCSAEQPGLHVSFYESPAALRAKAEALDFGLAPLLDQGHVQALWQPTTEGQLDEFCAEMMQTVQARNVARLFVDSLSGLVRLVPAPGRVEHIFTALMNELRGNGVTSLLTTETEDAWDLGAARPSAMAAPASFAMIVDNIVLLRLVEHGASLVRIISVRKARDSSIDPRLRVFETTGAGLVINPDPSAAEAILGGGIRAAEAPATEKFAVPPTSPGDD